MRIKRRAASKSQRQRGENGYWYAYPENGKPISLRTQDKAEALRELADRERKPKGDTVAAIVAAYLDDKADKPSIKSMTDTAKPVVRYFGHLRPDQIGREQSRAYATVRQGRSNGTIIKELSFLRAALYWNDKRSPAVIECPKTPPPRDRFLTKAEYRKMFFASPSPHFKVWLALAWYTAGRKTALLDLTWDRVNLETGKLILGADVGSKGRSPVTPIARALKRILRIAQRESVTAFVVERAGQGIHDIKGAFHSAAKRARLQHVTPHDVRRGAARHMIERGVSMEEVSQLLGHRSVTITARVYARFGPEFLRKAVGVL